MTILNTASDGFFNVLIVLHRTVAQHSSIDRNRLLRLCSGNDNDSKRLRETLNRWTQLGLFHASDNGTLKLDKADKNPDRLPSICRRLLFSEINNQNFWDNENNRAADFTRATAFILSQDIYASKFDTHAVVQALEQRQVRDETRRILQNDVRWNGLRFWGDYLGFFWVDHRRWPDPTTAIREELGEVFDKEKELTALDFIAQLSERIPVLDGGRYRLEIENILDTTEWQRPTRPDFLSTSLSRALWRLAQPGGPLRLESRADTSKGCTLQRAGGREWRTFTHALLTDGG